MAVKNMVSVLILYYSNKGRTETMAKAVAEGVRSVGDVSIIMRRVDFATVYDFMSCDAVAFGSPNYFGYMAGAMKSFFDRAEEIKSKVTGKPAVAFTSGGDLSDAALKSIEKMITQYKLEKVADGIFAKVDGTTEDVKIEDLAKCKTLGEALAKAAIKRVEEPKG
jgi:multimeric flavodoxin WrbA